MQLRKLSCSLLFLSFLFIQVNQGRSEIALHALSHIIYSKFDIWIVLGGWMGTTIGRA